MTCVRCRQELGLLGLDYIVLCNTEAQLCRECERAWLLAPESKRLRAISSSLLSEWIERERVEQLVVVEQTQSLEVK